MRDGNTIGTGDGNRLDENRLDGKRLDGKRREGGDRRASGGALASAIPV